MQQVNKYGRDYLTLLDDYGRTPSIQIGFYADTGHGKGMSEEGFIEEWKKTTNGVVIILADPKNEAEFSFANFEPKERYHLQELKKDGIEPSSHPVKLYHPFSFNIPKMLLPKINFYTFSFKDLNRQDWSILSETKSDSATIKLLNRASAELKREEGLFMFMQNVKKLTASNKGKKRKVGTSKDFYLVEPAGTAKSITEIKQLLYPFQNNYFLSKDNSNYKLDYEKILSDSDSYHVFLSMWLYDEKLQEFCVLHLLNSFILEIQKLSNKQKFKKPVLFVIPEIKKLCPVRAEGYKEHLANALGDALDTVRSVGRGVSIIYDSQTWSGIDEKIRTGESLFGRLKTKDKELVCKALSYTRENKDRLKTLSEIKCAFLRYEHEDDGIYRFFLPSHMHKEENDNWIETYKNNGREMLLYDSLKKEMRKEFDKENSEVKEMVKKAIEIEEKEKELKNERKEERKRESQKVKNPIKETEITDEMAKKFYDKWKIQKMSLREIEREMKEDPLIKVKPSIGTIRKYAKKHEESLKIKESDEGILSNMFENAF